MVNHLILIALSATESDIIHESSHAPSTEDGVGHEDISTSDGLSGFDQPKQHKHQNSSKQQNNIEFPSIFIFII